MTKPKSRSNPYPGTYKEKAGTWRYSFDAPRHLFPTRKQITDRGYATQQEASAAREAERAKMRAPGYAVPSAETLDAYFARWMRDTQASRRAATNLNYAACWKRLPASLRGSPLGTITPTQIRALYAELVARYAPGTAKETRAVLRMVLLAAHRERLMPYNPADGIPMKINADAQAEVAFDPEAVWSVAEQALFLNRTALHPHHTLWRLLLDSGLRIGEALALTWDDVDLERRTIRVQRTVTNDARNQQVLGKNPKTPQSRREVDVQPETIEALRRRLTAQKERRLQCGALWHHTNLVFDRGDGRMITRQIAHYQFKTALAQVDGVRPLTLHGLRHTMAVTWLKAGVEPVVVSKRLGHRDVAFTLNVYAKVTREWLQGAIEKVAKFIKETG